MRVSVLRNADFQRSRFGAVAVAGSLQASDQCGDAYSREQSQGQLAAVVGVKLQFRQQITGSDAQKSAGGESERGAQKMRRDLRKPLGAQIEQEEPDGIGQRKQAVDPVAQRPGGPADS